MPLTEDEFRTLLAERAATVAPPVDRLGSVHRRIVRRRRRQTAAAGAVLASTLLVAGIALPHLTPRQTNPVATPAPSATPLLTEYANGARLLASSTLNSPEQGEVTVTFTPSDWHLQIQLNCSDGWPSDTTWSAVRVNGRPLMEGTGCGAGTSAPYGGDQAYWTQLGVRLGQPSTVTLSLATPSTTVPQDLCRTCSPVPAGPSPLPAAQRPPGRLAVGVYQRVPLADYPLPARPATLTPLSRISGPGTLDSRDVGANGTFTVRAVVGSKTEIRTTATAPGALRLLVDGRPIDEHDSWRWDQVAGASTNLDQDTLRRAGLRIADGTTVTVTVEASRFTVPGWTVEVRRAP